VVVTDDLTREGLNRMAMRLYDMQASIAGNDLRRVLRACASQLETVALSLPSDGELAPFLKSPVVEASRTLTSSLGIPHRSAARLLALLLVEPGVTISCRALAASLGVSHQSVRVFAFHLRHWLAERGLGEPLTCSWGHGYRISPEDAQAILQQSPCLQTLVSVIRDEEAPARACEDGFGEPARTADPFPVVRLRVPEARVSA
jgi:hypothetical protein